MRRITVPLIAIVVLAIAAVAYAAQDNTYTVTGSTTSTKAGTSKKPHNTGLKFGYTVGEAAGQRPNVIKTYAIRVAGMKVNTQAFPKCPATSVDQFDPSDCPSGAKVGTGFIKNAAGDRNDPSDKSVPCNARLDVYNKGNNKGVIFIQGSQTSSDPRTRCAINLGAGIDARWIRSQGGKSSTLQFSVPDSLLHPLPTLSNAVTDVSSTITSSTRKYKGKRVSFYQSVGGCVRGKRNITVTFKPESGPQGTAQHLAKCKK